MNHCFMLAAVLAAAGLSACGKESGEGAANVPSTQGQLESSTGSLEAKELLDSPQLYELQYPVAEFKYASYELTGVVSDFAVE